MAQMQAKYLNIGKGICRETLWRYKGGTTKQHVNINLSSEFRISWKYQVRRIREEKKNIECPTTTSFSSNYSSFSTEELAKKIEVVEGKYGELGCLVREYGWKVRRMVEEESEMRKVAQIQAEAFHVPVLLFNDLFFQFFQAEVLSGLLYRLQNSPPDRYACLVAEPNSSDDDDEEEEEEVVGVVDVTVLRDEAVLQHLPTPANEYLYVSGIAVLSKFSNKQRIALTNNRRKKVGTALLKACEKLSGVWDYEYLVLRAYEDDLGALELYRNAGYVIVSGLQGRQSPYPQEKVFYWPTASNDLQKKNSECKNIGFLIHNSMHEVLWC
ncbi:unnamed protein product [Camellia sinensis]